MAPLKSFEHQVTARFKDIDRAGIVYFATLYAYCHATFEELLAAIFGPDLEASFAAGAWPLPLVHSEADYAHPVRLGERVRINLRVAHMGRTSIAFAYDLVGVDGVLRAKAKLVHACVDLQAFRPAPLPQALVAGLRGRGLVD